MAHMGSNNPFQGAPPIIPPAPQHPRPHVRLNSGVHNILTDFSQDNTATTSRSLTSNQYSQPNPLKPSPSKRSLYSNQPTAGESADLLLPPSKGRPLRFKDDDSPLESPISPSFSRRSSWSSESASPFASPFDDSRAPSRTGSEDELINTQTVAEKYNIQPGDGLLLYPEDVEKDDYLHNPDANDKEGYGCATCCSGRGLMNISGLIFIFLGALALFIGYPVLTFVQKIVDPVKSSCAGDPLCIDAQEFDLLKNVRYALVDPDTPKSAYTRTSHAGNSQKLVFSDEFNTDGRTFYDGDDPYFQAMDFWYGVTEDLEWYDPDAVSTEGGTLNIKFDKFENHNLNYRSGMLQSWNKMCFKGGHVEVSMSLPGRGDTAGFWPGVWAMGNLGRPGYAATTDGMWPYSYDNVCDAGITPNQSDATGVSLLPGMKMPACTCTGEDHPSPGISRSAPEIDIIEAQTVYLQAPYLDAIGSASQSFQVAPFDVFWRPDYDFIELYDPHITTMNSYCGGVYQQAISGISNLNNHWYDGNSYQTYAFEYSPGGDGSITWYVGDEATWTLDGRAVGPNGNIGQRVVPEEPMAMVINFGMSNSFQALNLTGLATLFPATMRVDYIRIYQDEGSEMVTCDPPGYPTTDYIAAHPVPYSNPNITHWAQTEYDWPQNSLMNGCKANSAFNS